MITHIGWPIDTCLSFRNIENEKYQRMEESETVIRPEIDCFQTAEFRWRPFPTESQHAVQIGSDFRASVPKKYEVDVYGHGKGKKHCRRGEPGIPNQLPR